jgi:hypothetical protein
MPAIVSSTSTTVTTTCPTTTPADEAAISAALAQGLHDLLQATKSTQRDGIAVGALKREYEKLHGPGKWATPRHSGLTNLLQDLDERFYVRSVTRKPKKDSSAVEQQVAFGTGGLALASAVEQQVLVLMRQAKAKPPVPKAKPQAKLADEVSLAQRSGLSVDKFRAAMAQQQALAIREKKKGPSKRPALSTTEESRWARQNKLDLKAARKADQNLKQKLAAAAAAAALVSAEPSRADMRKDVAQRRKESAHLSHGHSTSHRGAKV